MDRITINVASRTHPRPSPMEVVDKNRLSALGDCPSGNSGSTERAPPRSPSPTSPPAINPRGRLGLRLLPSMTPSPTFPDAEARHRVAGVLHDAVQERL